MILRFKALRSLRVNYKWRGVWVWLKGRRVSRPVGGPTTVCPACGQQRPRGYKRILREPEQVLAEQEATAEGVSV